MIIRITSPVKPKLVAYKLVGIVLAIEISMTTMPSANRVIATPKDTTRRISDNSKSKILSPFIFFDN